MKRFYMIATAALLAVGAQAQTLRVFMGNKEIEIGKTTKFEGGEIKDFGANGKDYKYDPELSLLSNQSGTCSLVANCISGQKIQMCFGGNCMTGTTVEKQSYLTAGVKQSLEFEFMGFTNSADEAIPSDVTTVFTAEQGATVIKFTVVINPSNKAVTVLADEYQLPNAGFENTWGDCIPWTSTGNTKAHGTTPSPWCISNVIGINGLGATMTGDKVMGYDSSGAVQITNTANTMLNTVAVPGYVTLGTTWSTSVMNQENDGGTFGGIDFKYRPKSLDFMYKRTRGDKKPNEKTTVIAYLWKGKWTQKDVPANIEAFGEPTKCDMIDRDRCVLLDYKNYMSSDKVVWTDNSFTPITDVVTKGGAITKSEDAELIAVAEITLTENQEDWTLCHADFTYFSNATPEKFNIIFAAGDYFGGTEELGIGNSLTVDDVKLIYENHEGFLNVEMGCEKLSTDQASTVIIVNKSETSCDFILPDFTLYMGNNMIPLGDIIVKDVTVSHFGNAKSYDGFVKDLALMDGEIVADVKVSGIIDADNFANMKIDVLWTNTGGNPAPIDVTFTTTAHPNTPILQINGIDVDASKTIVVKEDDDVRFSTVEGVDIHYLLSSESDATADEAPAKIPEDYTRYEGDALSFEIGKSYNLSYLAVDTKTGMQSELKSVLISTTTGIAAVEAENGATEYFTLQGVRVAEPTTGIYIRVANGKATKITVE